MTLIIEFSDRVVERLINRLHAVAQNVLETDQEWKLQSAAFGLLQNVGQINSRSGFLQRRGNDVPGFIDVKIFRAPPINVIKIARRLNIPGFGTVRGVSHWFVMFKTSAL
jgi:hypothetical protein